MYIRIFAFTFYLAGMVSTTPKRIVAYFMRLFVSVSGLYSTQKKSTVNTVNTTYIYTDIYDMNFLSRMF
jgi:hypothetical protein